MKVLQVISHYVPAWQFGGPLHVAHSLARALVDQGHTVTTVTTNMEAPESDLDVPLDEPVDVDGVRVFYEQTSPPRYWGYAAEMSTRTQKEIHAADVVLSHFHYQYASLAAGRAARHAGKPLVVFSHGSLNLYGVNARSTLFKKLYLAFIERLNFRNAIFTAYHSQEELENSLVFGRTAVIPNGIDPNDFNTLPPVGSFREEHNDLEGRLLFLFLGRLAPGKGLEILLPAFGDLLRDVPGAHLLLVGGDERGYANKVKRMVQELALSDHVSLTGMLSGKNKLAVLKDADVFVLPSRSEGLSIAMLEAMYMGLPVVVSDRVGLWRTIEAERCGTAVPYEAGRLRDALYIMATSADRKEMGRRARRLVEERHTWQVIARNLVAEIEKYMKTTVT